MPAPVDLYNSAYGNYAEDVYRQVRLATYGEDLGQTSWVSNEESRAIPQMLQLTPASRVLEIGCGSGAYALQIASVVGCSIVGVDINDAGVRNANTLARARHLADRVSFQHCDVSKTLPFPDAAFDAAFANDVLCHIPGRPALLEDAFRVLKPSARLLFSDALIIGGAVSHQEIATRSSIGYYIFTPPGYNERLIQDAGFHLLTATDTTQNAAAIAQRWRDAREQHRDALIAIEGTTNFEGLQQFLACVATLSCERRLLRYLYTAQKPA
jgi:cyclopropane fatty-acyl-phospholipid synthase-like methyltransferase